MLFPAVFLGGQIGWQLAMKTLPPDLIRRLTALLILYVSIRLLIRLVGVIAAQSA